MEDEEVVKVEWEQLPQRTTWNIGKGNGNGVSLKRKLATTANAELMSISSPIHRQAGSWEYLDHTADVQIHATGKDLKEAFGATAVGMFGYMVELDEIEAEYELEVGADGHDMESLLFNFLDECLYIFYTESFVMKEIIFKNLDVDKYSLTVLAKGGKFDASKHSQGTEVKAITYSNMQIVTDHEDSAEVFVIVDI